VTWREVEKGMRIEDFCLDNVRQRFAKVGDLWKPLLQVRGRVNLEKLLRSLATTGESPKQRSRGEPGDQKTTRPK
jgi:DNA primase